MSRKKDKRLRRAVRENVNDQCRNYLLAMMGSRLLTRLRYALIIVFRLGWRDLLDGGGNGTD